MQHKLRLYEAKRFEGKGLDKTVGFVHDVFFTPFSSAVGTSFVSFFAGTMMVVLTLSTQDTLSYMSVLAR